MKMLRINDDYSLGGVKKPYGAVVTAVVAPIATANVAAVEAELAGFQAGCSM